MVMNHTEGYRLFPENDAIQFRISAAPRSHVKGELRGSPDQFNRLRTALNNAEWHVGTAEVVHKHDEWRLHVTVTKEDCDVASPDDADTVVGVDVNEDCVALAAMDRNGEVKDSIVVSYPSIKERRHEFFTKRKRMQTAGQTGLESVVQTAERDYVHDCLHKVSRQVVDWMSQFTTPELQDHAPDTVVAEVSTPSGVTTTDGGELDKTDDRTRPNRSACRRGRTARRFRTHRHRWVRLRHGRPHRERGRGAGRRCTVWGSSLGDEWCRRRVDVHADKDYRQLRRSG
ncbi:MAG: hypothetical protein J07HQW2_02193 [Haloquadratum walsbyi J07HQW2]|uniref:Transposase n=2 Tax=Haloquadratum walsbyi TaxID=293091 RepID=U1NFY9_9EURY|nr:MAG: hypothetical protein J07HQW2_02193 [Haloquadratum walsbyi J07HQW2]